MTAGVVHRERRTGRQLGVQRTDADDVTLGRVDQVEGPSKRGVAIAEDEAARPETTVGCSTMMSSGYSHNCSRASDPKVELKDGCR